MTKLRFLRSIACSFAWLVAAAVVVGQEVRLRPSAVVYLDVLGAAINSPEAVAFDGKSRLVIADTGNRRLLLLDVSEDSITPTGEIRLAQLSYPIDVEITSRGNILALDGKSLKIVRISGDGDFQGFVDIPQEDRQQQVILRAFDLDSKDRLHVLDVSGARVLVLDSGGTLLREIAVPPEAGFLSDLTVTSTGLVFAIDTDNKQVFVARTGDEVMTPLAPPMAEDMAFPTSIDADTFGHLYIVDKTGGGIVIVGQNGEFQGRQSAKGWKQGFLRYPVRLWAGDDYLFVADRGNHRVQQFEIIR